MRRGSHVRLECSFKMWQRKFHFPRILNFSVGEMVVGIYGSLSQALGTINATAHNSMSVWCYNAFFHCPHSSFPKIGMKKTSNLGRFTNSLLTTTNFKVLYRLKVFERRAQCSFYNSLSLNLGSSGAIWKKVWRSLNFSVQKWTDWKFGIWQAQQYSNFLVGHCSL